jgi:hypothetical protein
VLLDAVHMPSIALGKMFPRLMSYFLSVLSRIGTSAGLSLFLFSAAQAADADRIEMRIEMFAALGVHVATSRTILEEATDRYAITTDVESRGLAAVFLNLASHSEVRGRPGMDTVRPEVYRGEVHRNGVHTYNRVDYGADGMVTGGSTPPGATRKPVTPALMRGTVDQLSALFIMERQLATRGSCARVVAVYDGLRRYDLHFTDAVPQTIRASGGHSFAGTTAVCRMRREAIAGFLDDDGRSEGAYAGTLSYGRLLPGDLIVPVRMEFSTEFGSVTGHLAELLGRGAHMRFME